jgi:hypothetical protein
MSHKISEEEREKIREHLDEERKIAEDLKRAFPKHQPIKEKIFEYFEPLKNLWKTGFNNYKSPYKNLERAKKAFFKKFIFPYHIPDFLLFNSIVLTNLYIIPGSFYKKINPFLTKKEAHIFLNLQPSYSSYLQYWQETKETENVITQAFLTAKTIARSFEPSFIALIVPSVSAKWLLWDEAADFLENFADQPSWIKKVKFTNDFLDFLKNHEDYKWNKNDWYGVLDFFANVLCTNDGFNFSGRTPQSLISLTNEWHIKMSRIAAIGKETWSGLPYLNKTYDDIPNEKTWAITQIKTEKDLHKEGKAMHHCVYSYLDKCLRGEVGIYRIESMNHMGDIKKEATVEIRRDRKIVQARALSNASISASCEKILRRYAKDNYLSF